MWHIAFSTPKRKFIVADTPGHEQYTRNMVTGASTADVAVILVNAQNGVQTQTRRHAYIASLMGIKHIVLAINKMDIVDYNHGAMLSIEHDFEQLAQNLSFESITCIPVSALKGDNITKRSEHTPWYTGPTLIGYLETVDIEANKQHNFVLPVQWVNRPHADFRGFSGSIAGGAIQVGDQVRVVASGQMANVKQLVTYDGDLSQAKEGDAITMVLDREIDASRGDVITAADLPLEMTDQIETTIIWLHESAGLTGRSYELKLANQWSGASITTIKHCIDINTGAYIPGKQLELNDIAVCNVSLSRPLAFDTYKRSKTMGGFILVDRFSQATVAAGLINHSLRRAQNVHRQAMSIDRSKREHLNGHKGKVIWFTGLSGSGKSTIANALEKQLHEQGKRTYILDGDNVRQGLNKDLGFTDADRVENIRRIAEVAKLMLDAGLIVMTAFISPFRAERQMARELIGDENFIEVFVDTPLHVCEQRDPKGLYKKARSGELPNMTGIGSAYEAPENPTIVIDSNKQNVEDAVKTLINII